MSKQLLSALADDLPAELERRAAQGRERVEVHPDLLVSAAAALRVLSAEVHRAAARSQPASETALGAAGPQTPSGLELLDAIEADLIEQAVTEPGVDWRGARDRFRDRIVAIEEEAAARSQPAIAEPTDEQTA